MKNGPFKEPLLSVHFVYMAHDVSLCRVSTEGGEGITHYETANGRSLDAGPRIWALTEWTHAESTRTKYRSSVALPSCSPGCRGGIQRPRLCRPALWRGGVDAAR